MWQFLTALFKAWSSTNAVIERSMGSEKVNDGKFEINKPTLTEAQVKKIADKRNRLADEMFGDLRRHPEIDIDLKVRFEAKELDEEEKILLVKILEQRLNADHIYSKLKSGKSKFSL